MSGKYFREVDIIKKQLRKHYLEYRDNMDKLQLLDWSEGIAQKVNGLKYVVESQNIFCFVSFGSEVNTHDLIKMWLSQGKNVSVPCIEKLTGGDRSMYAIQIKDFSDLNKRGSYGILEPGYNASDIVEPEKLDVVIVPGSVFDTAGNRLGYGGGFYDRFLAQTRQTCKKIGVCYDFQVLENIPHEEHDIPMDIIVTEKRIVE